MFSLLDWLPLKLSQSPQTAAAVQAAVSGTLDVRKTPAAPQIDYAKAKAEAESEERRAARVRAC